MSIEIRSPAFSGLSDGNPWTTCSFSDAQIVKGNGVWVPGLYPLNEGMAPRSRIDFSASWSSSSVLAPGRMASLRIADTSASRGPLWRISASSQGSLISATSLDLPALPHQQATAALHALALRADEAVVVPRHEVGLDLGDRVERHADEDEQAGATEAA